MAGTHPNTVPRRNRKTTGSTPTRAIVRLRPKALKELFAAEGISNYRDQIDALNHSSLGALSRAYSGGAVSAGLIAAVRLRFPEVPYERLFTEGTVATNAPANAAA